MARIAVRQAGDLDPVAVPLDSDALTVVGTAETSIRTAAQNLARVFTAVVW
jgi:hypothetical protein